MKDIDFNKLLAKTRKESEMDSRIGIVGDYEIASRIKDRIDYDNIKICGDNFESLCNEQLDTLVIASDEDKEEIIMDALPYIMGTPNILVSGYGHHRFKDPVFDSERSRLEVPSIANGYPNTLVHIYQSLKNASRLDLDGSVVELGTYKGGTTMLMSRIIKRLNEDWKVITFDNFDGFPPKRSPLDMYNHPGCADAKLDEAQKYLKDENVEIIPGDITDTVGRLEDEDIILSFIDTDNYTPAKTGLDIIRENTLIGGTIVFDHFTGINRFVQTLGEKLAGKELLDDDRYFHLHGTGVFYRQR